jgi:hypothetical protein
LGPAGLQQFVLDMQFVIQFASQGIYFSRHMHQVIKDIILRKMNAFASSGRNPLGGLKFSEICWSIFVLDLCYGWKTKAFLLRRLFVDDFFNFFDHSWKGFKDEHGLTQ